MQIMDLLDLIIILIDSFEELKYII